MVALLTMGECIILQYLSRFDQAIKSKTKVGPIFNIKSDETNFDTFCIKS